jgi:hypothetical protein
MIPFAMWTMALRTRAGTPKSRRLPPAKEADTPDRFLTAGVCAMSERWRRRESNPGPQSRMNGVYERSRRSDLVLY